MSSLVISGDTSGTVTVAAPAVAGSNTLTLQAGTATNSMNTLSTAVTSTSGTSIDFTGLPTWVKRITVMFNGVSLTANANILVQLGTGATPTYTTSGYTSTANGCSAGGNSVVTSTAGFILFDQLAAGTISGHMILTNISGNIWISSNTAKRATDLVGFGAGDVALAAVLTAVRITTTSTDTFDAGSINILYEG